MGSTCIIDSFDQHGCYKLVVKFQEEVSEAATDVTVTKKKVVSESAAESAPENGNGELRQKTIIFMEPFIAIFNGG